MCVILMASLWKSLRIQPHSNRILRMFSNVKYKVEEFTGMEIKDINVFVEGVRPID